jgi:hypothetical protein
MVTQAFEIAQEQDPRIQQLIFRVGAAAVFAIAGTQIAGGNVSVVSRIEPSLNASSTCVSRKEADGDMDSIAAFALNLARDQRDIPSYLATKMADNWSTLFD